DQQHSPHRPPKASRSVERNDSHDATSAGAWGAAPALAVELRCSNRYLPSLGSFELSSAAPSGDASITLKSRSRWTSNLLPSSLVTSTSPAPSSSPPSLPVTVP